MHVVTVINNNVKFYLKGTTWTSSLDRASKFASDAIAAEFAIKAERFMAPKIRKSYKIEKL
jgi:hypothetical protein